MITIIKNSIERDNNGLFICPFCLKHFNALVYHTRQKHGVDKVELRKMFNLPLNYSLENEHIKQNRREKALFYGMDKQLINAGKKNRFKKGYKQPTELTKAISRGHMKRNRNKFSGGDQ